jgi:hypothetical protein
VLIEIPTENTLASTQAPTDYSVIEPGLGSLQVKSKLMELGFQTRAVEVIKLCLDLHEVFNTNKLESRLILDARDLDLVNPHVPS